MTCGFHKTKVIVLLIILIDLYRNFFPLKTRLVDDWEFSTVTVVETSPVLYSKIPAFFLQIMDRLSFIKLISEHCPSFPKAI